MLQIRILQQLKSRIEKETGVPLPSGPSEKLPPLAERRRPPGRRRGAGGGGGSGRGRQGKPRSRDAS
jgi:hypothetical protein